MKNQLSSLLFVFCTGALAAACSSDSSGTPAGTGGTGAGGSSSTGEKLVPGDTGFVDGTMNTFGITGSWYAYADSIGSTGMPPGNCQSVGMHTDAQCSKVASPAPGSFPQTVPGQMCTEGDVETLQNIVGGTGPDYDNMWGAGIGLDFNNPGGTAMKAPFDARAKGAKGVSFTIDTPPATGLRVEFPDAVTNGKSAAYWGAMPDGKYPPSPVKAGLNTITWDLVKPPASTITALDVTKLMGIQFHVVSGTAAHYKFCISDLTILK
jgi:hypothetical protein